MEADQERLYSLKETQRNLSCILSNPNTEDQKLGSLSRSALANARRVSLCLFSGVESFLVGVHGELLCTMSAEVSALISWSKTHQGCSGEY